MSLVVKRYKKLVKELLFAYSELEFIDEVLSDAHGEFEMYYQDFCRKNDVPLEELNKKNSARLEKVFPKKEIETDEDGIIKIEHDEEEKRESKIFQRMYRIMAKKLHPDKFSNVEKTPEVLDKIEAFKTGTNAYDKKNWSVFLDICEKYDIIPTRYEKINSLIKQEIRDLGEKINNKKLSFSWRLFECEDNEGCKDKVIKDFLFQLFKYRIGGENGK
jgi:hypothetical protein